MSQSETKERNLRTPLTIEDVLTTLHNFKKKFRKSFSNDTAISNRNPFICANGLGQSIHIWPKLCSYHRICYERLQLDYRSMMLQVLDASDSAFQRVAVRGSNNEPLTLLVLMIQMSYPEKKSPLKTPPYFWNGHHFFSVNLKVLCTTCWQLLFSVYNSNYAEARLINNLTFMLKYFNQTKLCVGVICCVALSQIEAS